MRRCGKRASGSAAAWLAPPAGHPLQHNFSRDIPDATPPRKSCITSPSPSLSLFDCRRATPRENVLPAQEARVHARVAAGIKGNLEPRVRKFGRKTISVTPTGANGNIGNTGPGLSWEVGWGGGRPIRVRRCGKRASGSAAAWLAPPAGHPLQHNFSRDIPDAIPPRKSCITSPSPSLSLFTHQNAAHGIVAVLARV